MVTNNNNRSNYNHHRDPHQSQQTSSNRFIYRVFTRITNKRNLPVTVAIIGMAFVFMLILLNLHNAERILLDMWRGGYEEQESEQDKNSYHYDGDRPRDGTIFLAEENRAKIDSKLLNFEKECAPTIPVAQCISDKQFEDIKRENSIQNDHDGKNKNNNNKKLPLTMFDHDLDENTQMPISKILSIMDSKNNNNNNIDAVFNFTQADYDFCSNNPMYSCYSPRCFFPVDVSNSDNKNQQKEWTKYRLSPKYLASNHSGCFPNPFYTRPKKSTSSLQYDSEEIKKFSKGYPNREFSCPFRKSQRTQYFEENKEENKKFDPLYKFKNLTSWMFSKWYDWTGKCVNKDENTGKNNNKNDYIIRGEHSSKDGLYRLSNVCLRARGGFGGYFPLTGKVPMPENSVYRTRSTGRRRRPMTPPKHYSIDHFLARFVGTDDVFKAVGTINKEIAKWLNNIDVPYTTRFRLDKPADCYLDTKVVLMPITSRTDNAGHTFYRAGSMLRNIESAFGKEAMLKLKHDSNGDTNVTIGYVVVDAAEGVMDSKKSHMKSNTFSHWYDLLGTSWFSFFGTDLTPRDYRSYKRDPWLQHNRIRRADEALFGFKPDADELDETMACFKEVVIWQNSAIKNVAYGMHNASAVAHEFTPGAQTSFHIHGHRQVRDKETLAILDDKVRACGVALPPRRKRIRHHNPHVVFAIRSLWRRFTLQPFITSHMAQTIARTFGPGATFELIEHTKLHVPDIVKRYTNADIVIGMYGASLVWTCFSPPQTVIVEFNNARIAWWRNFGINVNPLSEYGGQAVAAQQFHLVLNDNRNMARYATDADHRSVESDIIGSLGHFEKGLQMTSCVMKETRRFLQIRTNPDQVQCFPTPQCCQTNHKDYESFEFQKKLYLDRETFRDQFVPMIIQTRLNAKGLKVEDSLSVNYQQALSSSSSSSSSSSPSSTTLQRYLAQPDVNLELPQDQIFFHSPRLQLIQNSLEVRKLFVKSTLEHSIPSEHEVISEIMIVADCEALPEHYAEASALKAIMQRPQKVTIAEYFRGKDECKKIRSKHIREEVLNQHHHHQSHNNNNTTTSAEPAPPAVDTSEKVPKILFVETRCDFTVLGLTICQYPCSGIAPFDLVIMSCHHHREDGRNEKKKNCIVDFDNKNNNIKMNSSSLSHATHVYRNTVNGLTGVLLAFDLKNEQLYVTRSAMVGRIGSFDRAMRGQGWKSASSKSSSSLVSTFEQEYHHKITSGDNKKTNNKNTANAVPDTSIVRLYEIVSRRRKQWYLSGSADNNEVDKNNNNSFVTFDSPDDEPIHCDSSTGTGLLDETLKCAIVTVANEEQEKKKKKNLKEKANANDNNNRPILFANDENAAAEKIHARTEKIRKEFEVLRKKSIKKKGPRILTWFMFDNTDQLDHDHLGECDKILKNNKKFSQQVEWLQMKKKKLCSINHDDVSTPIHYFPKPPSNSAGFFASKKKREAIEGQHRGKRLSLKKLDPFDSNSKQFLDRNGEIEKGERYQKLNDKEFGFHILMMQWTQRIRRP